MMKSSRFFHTVLIPGRNLQGWILHNALIFWREKLRWVSLRSTQPTVWTPRKPSAFCGSLFDIRHSTRWVPVFRFCMLICLAFWGPGAVPVAAQTPATGGDQSSLSISQVAVSPRQFDPSRGETVVISYSVSQPAKAIVKIFDPEMQLVRDLMSESRKKSEVVQVVWDGKDAQGRVVPDEAYFFTIEASDYQGRMALYDPATLPGNNAAIEGDVRFDSEKQRVFYQIPVAARVKIRAGIAAGGPLLKNILHGVPRAAGNYEEIWDGRDETGKLDVTTLKNYQLIMEATALFENTIIARGNSEYDYFRYRREIASERPRKFDRPVQGREFIWAGLPRPEPIRMIPEPKFHIELPETESKSEVGALSVAGKIPIRMYLNESIKKYITEQRYEIIFFVDFRFVTEKEEGYSPFTLTWDALGTPNGEHVITINVATFSGEVSSASARVMVRNKR
jgi:hypothetical protein